MGVIILELSGPSADIELGNMTMSLKLSVHVNPYIPTETHQRNLKWPSAIAQTDYHGTWILRLVNFFNGLLEG